MISPSHVRKRGEALLTPLLTTEEIFVVRRCKDREKERTRRRERWEEEGEDEKRGEKFQREGERVSDGETFQQKDTRVPSQPRYDLRKRTHSQQQQNNMLLLIHKFEKLSIHEMNEEDLSKTLKESVDSKGLSFPHFPFIY